MNKKISVIVPVYKAEKYIDNCLNSIVNQTYANLEIIVVDDGSPDSCPEICDDWAKKDGRIKVIHKQNGGVSAARNTGLDASSGDYITFVDSDDFIEPNMLQVMLNKIQGEGKDMVACSFMFDHLDKESVAISLEKQEFFEQSVLVAYLQDKIRPEACGKLYAKKAVSNVRFDTQFGYAEDMLFNYNALKNCKSVATISGCFYHYLQDSGNSSTTAKITHHRANSYKVFEQIVTDCKNSQNAHLFDLAVKRFTVSTFAVLSRVMTDSQFDQLYFDQIANAILQYKKNILKSKIISPKYKISVLLMLVNKSLFKFIYKKIGR